MTPIHFLDVWSKGKMVVAGSGGIAVVMNLVKAAV